jgi:hypothetical protein
VFTSEGELVSTLKGVYKFTFKGVLVSTFSR